MSPRSSKRPDRSTAVLALALALGLLAPGAVLAETAEEKGYAIAARADRSDRGFGDGPRAPARGRPMPKMKSKGAVKKRFRVTKGGKL